MVSADDNKPRCVTLRVKMAAETRRTAARIAREYAGRKLETVVAAFVGDLAVAAERPGSWEHERVSAWLSSHVWECEPRDERPRLRSEEVMDCSAGNYPWDDWQRCAIARGVPVELAALGRAAIREAWQHEWSERLRSLCGWSDDGGRMLRLALRNPQLAEKRWSRLLETDGGLYEPPSDRAE